MPFLGFIHELVTFVSWCKKSDVRTDTTIGWLVWPVVVLFIESWDEGDVVWTVLAGLYSISYCHLL